MVKLGYVHNIIDDTTIQVSNFDDDELFEVKGKALSIDNIKEAFDDSNTCFVEYDDEDMQLVD